MFEPAEQEAERVEDNQPQQPIGIHSKQADPVRIEPLAEVAVEIEVGQVEEKRNPAINRQYIQPPCHKSFTFGENPQQQQVRTQSE